MFWLCARNHCKRFVIVRNYFRHKWSGRGELYVKQTGGKTSKDIVPVFFGMCGYYVFIIPSHMKLHKKILVYQGKTLRYTLKSRIKEVSEMTLKKIDKEAMKDNDGFPRDIVVIEGDRYVAYANGQEFIDYSSLPSTSHTSAMDHEQNKIKLESYPIYSISCLICLDNFMQNEEIFLLQCGHGFHRECIVSAFAANNLNCPICSAECGTRLITTFEDHTPLLYDDRNGYNTIGTLSV